MFCTPLFYPRRNYLFCHDEEVVIALDFLNITSHFLLEIVLDFSEMFGSRFRSIFILLESVQQVDWSGHNLV